jgi:predicted membrane protein
METKQFNIRLVIGIIIIAVGGLLLLGNLDIIDYTIPSFLLSWKSILIIIGLIVIANSGNNSTGLILIGIGLIAHLPEFWPVILIVLGLYLIARTKGFGKFYSPSENSSEPFVDGERVNDVAVFGGGKKYFQTNNFRGGKITAIFGGSEIDLIDCKLAEGDNILDVFAMFGGSTILVPSEWRVELDLIPIFGGFSDSRRKDPNLVQPTDRKLKVKGFVLFGGGEIKN